MLEKLSFIAVLAAAVGSGAALVDQDRRHEAQTFPKTPSAVAKMGAPLEIERGPDGLFHVPVSFDGRTFDVIFDTGATRTVIDSAVLHRMRAGGVRTSPVAAGKGTLLTFSGEVRYDLVAVRDVRIGSYALGPLHVAVVGLPGSPSVIGQDVISRLSHVTIRGDRLLIG